MLARPQEEISVKRRGLRAGQTPRSNAMAIRAIESPFSMATIQPTRSEIKQRIAYAAIHRGQFASMNIATGKENTCGFRITNQFEQPFAFVRQLRPVFRIMIVGDDLYARHHDPHFSGLPELLLQALPLSVQ